jgi:hypothetical protein
MCNVLRQVRHYQQLFLPRCKITQAPHVLSLDEVLNTMFTYSTDPVNIQKVQQNEQKIALILKILQHMLLVVLRASTIVPYRSTVTAIVHRCDPEELCRSIYQWYTQQTKQLPSFTVDAQGQFMLP